VTHEGAAHRFKKKQTGAPNKESVAAKETSAAIRLSPDYSRCVGVDMEKACFIGVLFQVCRFDSSPTT
jgi:hypothetical protein